jgi:hypothetical protein
MQEAFWTAWRRICPRPKEATHDLNIGQNSHYGFAHIYDEVY